MTQTVATTAVPDEKQMYAAAHGRVEGVDGLRAIAVLLVFSVHASIPHLGGGGIGVDIFFAISGFLITRTFILGDMNLENFWINRALRVYPALFVVTIVGAFAMWVSGPLSPLDFWNNVLPPLLGVANLAGIYLTGPTYMGHSWSLAVEEQFYLVYPLMFLLIVRFSKKYASLVILALIFSIVVYRMGLFKYAHVSVVALFRRADTRVDGLFWGAFLAVSSVRVGKRLSKFWPLAILFLAGAAQYEKWWQDWLYMGGFSLLALASCIIIANLVLEPEGLLSRILSFYPLKKLGELSYGFYLWHFVVIRVVGTQIKVEGGAIILLDFAITYFLALVSWQFIECKVMAHRRTILTIWSNGQKKAVLLYMPISLIFGAIYIVIVHKYYS